VNPKIFEIPPDIRGEYLASLQDISCILSSEERQIMNDMETSNKAWALYDNIQKEQKKQEIQIFLKEIDSFYENKISDSYRN